MSLFTEYLIFSRTLPPRRRVFSATMVIYSFTLFLGDFIANNFTQPAALPAYQLAAIQHLNATHPGTRMAVAYKERHRLWLRDALTQLNAADPDTLATQVAILVEGAIIAALVRGDPGVARAAKAAARVLLTAAGVPDPEAPDSRD